MTDNWEEAEQIAARINARPILYWSLRAIAVVSLAAGGLLWPGGQPPQSLMTPIGLLLFAGTLMHYLQKAIFGIPFLRPRTLYYDFVVVLSALALLIAVQGLAQVLDRSQVGA